jgi:hypothetical protein
MGFAIALPILPKHAIYSFVNQFTHVGFYDPLIRGVGGKEIIVEQN